MLEEFVQRKKKDLISSLLSASIIMGALAAVFFGGALGSLPRFAHGHFDLVRFIICAIIFGAIAFVVIRSWIRLPNRAKAWGRWFLEAMANKERLEEEFADIKTLILISQQGDDPQIKEIATRSLAWGWRAVVHNKKILDEGCSELLLNQKDHTF